MSSPENLYSPLHISLPLYVLCNDSYDEASSTTIVLIPNSTPPVSIIPPLKTVDEEAEQLLNEKRRSTRTILMANVSRRFCRRKVLHNRLCTINNSMCYLGLLGVVLMIIENEITFIYGYEKNTYLRWYIRLIITITTGILVSLVFYYHRLNLSLYAVNNSLAHWRVSLTGTKIFFIFFEAFICMIHPIPRYTSLLPDSIHDDLIISDFLSPSYKAMDATLSLSMFARIYLVCRCIMFHSHLICDISLRSIGSFNRVSFGFFFLVKVYLKKWPARCLLVFCLFLFCIGGWSLRACNYDFAGEHISMLDSMWLFIVTFTTVGYEDLTPLTYCGRGVAAITALLGVLSTALLISILAHKLELTRSENYVHNFVLNIGLAKERKIQAANVIKYTIKLWFLRRKHRHTSSEYIKIERRLFRSIHFNQQLKQKQSKLVDNCVGIPELLTIEREAYDKTQENTQKLTIMNLKVDKIEEKLVDMNQTMTNIQDTLHLLLNRISQ